MSIQAIWMCTYSESTSSPQYNAICVGQCGVRDWAGIFVCMPADRGHIGGLFAPLWVRSPFTPLDHGLLTPELQVLPQI